MCPGARKGLHDIQAAGRGNGFLVGPEGLPKSSDFNLLHAHGAKTRCEENQRLKILTVPLFWVEFSAFPAFARRVV